MIIRIVPETAEEKEKYQEVEHCNIRDFFIFGNKRDADGDLKDFHEWRGDYKYLEGNLYYFLTSIQEERRMKYLKQSGFTFNQPMIKRGTMENEKLKPVDVEAIQKKIQNEELKEVPNNIIEFPKLPVQDNEDEVEHMENQPKNQESKNAED